MTTESKKYALPLFLILAGIQVSANSIAGSNTPEIPKKICDSIAVSILSENIPIDEQNKYKLLIRNHIEQLIDICNKSPRPKKLIKTKAWKKTIYRGAAESEYSQSGCALLDNGTLDCVYYHGELDTENNGIKYLTDQLPVEVND